MDNSIWKQNDFEYHVDSALIAMYETKVKKVRSQHPSMCGNEKDLQFFRKLGPYIPGVDRIVALPDNGDRYFYDTNNDGLLNHGCLGAIIAHQPNQNLITGYFDLMTFQKINYLPKPWVRTEKGKLYKNITCIAQNDGMHLRKTFFTLYNDKITACDMVLQSNYGRLNGAHKIVSWKEYEPQNVHDCEFTASVAMQFVADSRFCWSIKAEESEAKVRLGCQKEEIKSLLYARSLPMTETGRKRPVLHLVEAHKRRLKNGTDIDITSFLRGSAKVEMNGTIFTVIPPKVMAPDVSKNSQQYFAEVG